METDIFGANCLLNLQANFFFRIFISLVSFNIFVIMSSPFAVSQQFCKLHQRIKKHQRFSVGNLIKDTVKKMLKLIRNEYPKARDTAKKMLKVIRN